jgi:hypothetical protein
MQKKLDLRFCPFVYILGMKLSSGKETVNIAKPAKKPCWKRKNKTLTFNN